MSWTANSYFVTVAILFLWRVQEIAEACSCSPAHPQQAFCNSDVGKCQRWVPQKGSIFLLVPSVSVAVIPEKKKKEVKTQRGEKVAPLFVFTVTRGGVGGGGAEGGIFCLSQPFSPLPSSAPSLSISSYCFSRVTDVLKLFFLLKHLKWFSANKGRRIENRFWLCPFLLFLS